ncbi:MAG: hypothetical protein DRP11_00615 [Candidatus Aenigmatarchaeota archaeon]|nr:MAG: hypothetical protein DRP11_00615 [Candidatus Aenigmarchaeota archaeon]
MKFWRPPISLGREEDINKEFALFLNEVTKAVERLQDSVLVFSLGNLEKAREFAKKISEHEAKADEHRRRVEKMLYSEGFLPYDRSDKVALTEMLDDIADAAEITANFCTLRKVDMPDDLKDLYDKLSRKVQDAMRNLKSAVVIMDDNLAEAIKLIGAVEEDRKEARKITHQILEKLFSDKMDPTTIIFLKELAYRLMRVADMAEEASDRLSIMAARI